MYDVLLEFVEPVVEVRTAMTAYLPLVNSTNQHDDPCSLALLNFAHVYY